MITRTLLHGLMGTLAPTLAMAPAYAVTALPPTPGASSNNTYRVRAENEDVFVASERSNGRCIATCFLEIDGPTTLDIRLPCEADRARVSPHHRWESGPEARQIRRTGRRLTLTLNQPENLFIRIPQAEPLLLVALAPQPRVPDPSDPDVTWFGPGIHHAGNIRVRSGQTVYLAPGSRVYGTIEGYEVENVHITGRGILDGSLHTSRSDRTFGLVFDRSRNIRIDGIRIRECLWWVTEFLLCDHVRIENLNILSFHPINGGLMLDSCTDVAATHCTILTNDDCICPHALNAAGNGEVISSHLRFENCLLFNIMTGNAIRIGASLETSEVRNWTFKDITVVERHGAGVISDHSDWAVVRNLVFENVYDESGANYIIDMRIGKTRYSCTTGYKDERGSYDGVYFTNVQTAKGKWRLHGFDEDHRIQNIFLNRCHAEGRLITAPGAVETNGFVSGLVICTTSDDCRPAALPPSPLGPGRTAESLVIDNGDEGFSAYGFELERNALDSHEQDVHTADVPDGFSHFKAAVYQPQLEGRYRIDTYWGDFAGTATNSQWIVFHADGYTTRYLSQTRNPGWHALGVFDLRRDSYVRLVLPGYFIRTNGPVVADAVRFSRIAD